MYILTEPGGFPDICFLALKLMLFEGPASFLTFVFGGQSTCFFFEIPMSLLTFVVGEGFLIFVLMSKTHVFFLLRAPRVS